MRVREEKSMVGKIVIDGVGGLCTAIQVVLFVVLVVKWLFANAEVQELYEQRMKELKTGAECGESGGNICENSKYNTGVNHSDEYLQFAVIRRDAIWVYIRLCRFLLGFLLVIKILA